MFQLPAGLPIYKYCLNNAHKARDVIIRPPKGFTETESSIKEMQEVSFQINTRFSSQAIKSILMHHVACEVQEVSFE